MEKLMPSPLAGHESRFEEGNKVFARLFSRWMDMNSWSHPVMVGLARGCMGDVGWLHSSQISGLRHARLRSPGPRTFIAIAELNHALWEYQTKKKLIPGTTSSNAYRDPYVITENGHAPSVGWWVEVFCGTRAPQEISLDTPEFTEAQAEAVSKALARYIRRLAALSDYDPVDDLDAVIREHYPSRERDRVETIKQVLKGTKTFHAPELAAEMEALTQMSSSMSGVRTQEDLLALAAD